MRWEFPTPTQATAFLAHMVAASVAASGGGFLEGLPVVHCSGEFPGLEAAQLAEGALPGGVEECVVVSGNVSQCSVALPAVAAAAMPEQLRKAVGARFADVAASALVARIGCAVVKVFSLSSDAAEDVQDQCLKLAAAVAASVSK